VTAFLDLLLGSLIVSCWLGVLGMWRMREPMQALHYLALPAWGATIFLTAAVFLQTGNSQAAWKTLLMCLVRGPCHGACISRPRTWPLATARRRPNRICPPRERQVIWCGAGILIMVAISGFMVVRTQNVIEQVIALSFYGLVTALMFFFFQAPDVALSQITVGAVALPLMIMLALSRMKFRELTKRKEGEHD
jgi:energy-converting hydrogenase B subunit D